MTNITPIVCAFLLTTSACAAEPISISISSATVTHEERSGQTILSIELTEASRKILQRLSTDHLGRPLAIRVDGQTLLKPVVREPLTTRSFQISDPKWTDDQVRVLADRLSQPGARLDVDGVD